MLRKKYEDNISNSTKLVKNWINRISTLEELKEKAPDLQLISGMRFSKQIDLQNLKDYLNNKYTEYSEQIGEK